MKIKNVNVYGLDNAIRVSKFPMAVDTDKLTNELGKSTKGLFSSGTGQGHDQALTGIIVQFDLTFSNKAWVEAERYHFFDFISSTSTMHRITKFNIKEQCNEYVDDRTIAVVQEYVDKYNSLEDKTTQEAIEIYLKILYNVPAGFQLTAGMTTNYRQLKTIYYQRRYHRLPEWREFCKWIETLPRFKELVLGEENV